MVDLLGKDDKEHHSAAIWVSTIVNLLVLAAFAGMLLHALLA